MLSEHPDLAEQAPYNPKEAFMDFLDQRRDQLDQQLPDLYVWERDALELNWLDIVRQGLQDGGPPMSERRFSCCRMSRIKVPCLSWLVNPTGDLQQTSLSSFFLEQEKKRNYNKAFFIWRTNPFSNIVGRLYPRNG